MCNVGSLLQPDNAHHHNHLPADSSEEEEEGSPRGGHGKHRSAKVDAEDKEWRSNGKMKGKSAGPKAGQKLPLSNQAHLFKQVHKFLFGWMDPHFKRNGKKLVADSSVIFKFMVSQISDICLFPP